MAAAAVVTRRRQDPVGSLAKASARSGGGPLAAHLARWRSYENRGIPAIHLDRRSATARERVARRHDRGGESPDDAQSGEMDSMGDCRALIGSAFQRGRLSSGVPGITQYGDERLL